MRYTIATYDPDDFTDSGERLLPVRSCTESRQTVKDRCRSIRRRSREHGRDCLEYSVHGWRHQGSVMEEQVDGMGTVAHVLEATKPRVARRACSESGRSVRSVGSPQSFSVSLLYVASHCATLLVYCITGASYGHVPHNQYLVYIHQDS